MASSPPAPSPLGLPNPKKRMSMSSQASSQSVNKRPKLHPLRQTSFPAHEASGQYSSAITSAGARSETGSVANSLVSGVSSKVKGRGRGRPRKSAQLNDDDVRNAQTPPGDAASQVEGSRAGGRGTRSVVSARSGAVEAADDEEDDEGDAAGNEDMTEQEKMQAKEEEDRLFQRQKRLVESMDPDQEARYHQWRMVALSNTTVKRLVNSIVSQSVTSGPLLAIRSYAKLFVGEIVERAREVQMEFATAYDETRKEERESRKAQLRALEEKQKDLGSDTTSNQARIIIRDVARLKKEVDEYIPNPHRGGLLPDHLREALRRYKAGGEGGGVGFQGMSHGLLGVSGPAAWRVGDGASGKRLFR